MTKLSVTCTFGTSCNLSVANTTGFTPDNVNGFLPSSTTINWGSNLQANSFKLSEVSIFTAVIYNGYGIDATLENTTNGEIESPILITDDTKFPSSVAKTYSLDIDGYYTIGQFIALDKTYYEANFSTARFLNTYYIVYDSVNKLLYVAYNGNYTQLTVVELFDDHLTQIANMRAYHKVVSTCKMYNCYMDQMENFIPMILNKCATDKYKDQYNNVLVIYATLKAIEYRVYLCDYNIAQYYVEWLNSCANICSTNSTSTKTCSTCS